MAILDIIIGSPLAKNDSLGFGKPVHCMPFTDRRMDSIQPTNSPLLPIFAFGNRGHIQLGHIVNNIGDINGDGYSDVAVGSKPFNGDKGKGHHFLWR